MFTPMACGDESIDLATTNYLKQGGAVDSSGMWAILETHEAFLHTLARHPHSRLEV
jgi:agmatine/peptidylarginine deiminase